MRYIAQRSIRRLGSYFLFLRSLLSSTDHGNQPQRIFVEFGKARFANENLSPGVPHRHALLPHRKNRWGTGNPSADQLAILAGKRDCGVDLAVCAAQDLADTDGGGFWHICAL